MITRSYDELPAEIITFIATFLSLQEMSRLAATNKRFQAVINNVPLSNFGLWAINHKGEEIFRPAIFKELSDDMNEQLAERRKIEKEFAEYLNKEKKLKDNLAQAKRIRNYTNSACPMIFTLLSGISAATLTFTGGIKFIVNYELKGLMPIFVGSTVTAAGTMVVLTNTCAFTYNLVSSLDDNAKKKVEVCKRDLENHRSNSNSFWLKEKLNEPIVPQKVIPIVENWASVEKNEISPYFRIKAKKVK